MINVIFSRTKVLRFGDRDLDSAEDNANAQSRIIKKRYTHPKWNQNSPLYYDIGIWEFDKISFNKYVAPICLPSIPTSLSDKYKNDFATLTGWGNFGLEVRNDENILRQTPVRIFPQGYEKVPSFIK